MLLPRLREHALMMPQTMGRVPAHTPDELNQRIQRGIERSVRFHAEHPHLIDDRLEELDGEWDIERVLEANASSIILLGLGLAASVDRRFLWLPAGVAAFLLQHAIQGWCPPVTMFRRFGFRTAAEIHQERYALKALRGDFEQLSRRGSARGEAALEAVRA